MFLCYRGEGRGPGSTWQAFGALIAGEVLPNLARICGCAVRGARTVLHDAHFEESSKGTQRPEKAPCKSDAASSSCTQEGTWAGAAVGGDTRVARPNDGPELGDARGHVELQHFDGTPGALDCVDREG